MDDGLISNSSIHQLLPLSENCRNLIVQSELGNPVLFYSQSLFSVGQFLQEHKNSLSVADCNGIVASIIVARLVISANMKATECGVLGADKVKELILNFRFFKNSPFLG